MTEYSMGIAIPNYYNISEGVDTTASNPLWQAWSQQYSGQQDNNQQDTQANVEDPYTAFLKAQAAEEKRLRTMNAITSMKGLMESYGLSSLMNKITGWITDGYEGDAIMALVRQSKEYEQRFPAMKALAAKGRAISEAEYISYEQAAAGYERLYGLPAGMLTSKDQITKLLSNEVSARELEERTVKASQSQYSLPEEYRRMFRDYYGVDSGGLTAYYLDPDVAAPLLERQFVSAQIGMEGALQGVGVGSDVAEMLYQQGVNREQARQGFQQVAASKELTTGRGDTVTQEDLIKGTMTDNAAAQASIERAAASRVGRFSGGGSFLQNQGGAVGLGSSSTT
jgi:hypothetical protein